MSEAPTHSTVRDPDLATQPNKYAHPSGLVFAGESVRMEGYQTFSIHGHTLEITPETPSLTIKKDLLSKYLNPQLMKGRSVLDLGGNNGFYALTSLANGAVKATVVDLDLAPIQNIQQLKQHFPAIPVEGVYANVMEWKSPADVVIAFALIHWVYNLTTGLGSLEKAIDFLAGLTNDVLLIEWVDPADQVIVQFNHTGLKGEAGASDYTQANFEKVLFQHFLHVENLGAVSSTRTLYAASNKMILDLDGTWKVPFLSLEGCKLIQSRQIIPGVFSRVYDTGDAITKQVSLAHGLNEFTILSQCNHRAIPSATLLQKDDASIVFRLEKRPGLNLRDLQHAQGLVPMNAIKSIATELASVLEDLESKGILHGDIHPENVLFDAPTNALTLIDFGWASKPAEGQGAFPDALGDRGYFRGRLGSAPPSDCFAYGALILWLLKGQRHPLEWVGHWCTVDSPRLADVAALLRESEDLYPTTILGRESFRQNLAAQAFRLRHDCATAVETGGTSPTWLLEADMETLRRTLQRKEEDLSRITRELQQTYQTISERDTRIHRLSLDVKHPLRAALRGPLTSRLKKWFQ